MKRLSLLLTSVLCPLILSTAVACSDDDDDQGEDPQIEAVQAAEPIRQDSGMNTRERLVIRDQAAWTDAWRKLTSRSANPIAIPVIDFEERAVIVASMGEKNSSSFSISVDDVDFSGDNADLVVTETAPAAGCTSLPTISHPVAVVTVPAFTGKATFEEKTAEQPCN